jgi:hypothetical protein
MDTPSLGRQLLAEAKLGFPNLKGARLTGTVPIPESVLNELLSPVASGNLTLRLEEGDRIAGRYGGIPIPSARIVGVDSSLTIALRFSLWATPALWVARRRNIPYVRFAGNEIHIAVGAIPSIAAYRYIWKYLNIRLSTQPALLVVRLGIDFT